MPKEIKEKIIEIVLEIFAFNRNSEKFQTAINQILELFAQEKEKWAEETLEKLKEKFKERIKQNAYEPNWEGGYYTALEDLK